ncbi:MAG TPA: lysylphosphatidylglycerol synthase transmembrane domain-containing protein [Gemmatimonadaceae bacterium]|nr:lysylphosphatidylglycerol synthase transmembrane domain-containing protein [Gemmatimonadaceae bacterium]
MRFGWRGAVGLVISIGLLAWVLRDVHLREVFTVLGNSNLGLFILSALVATTIFPLRALRWRYILWPIRERLPLGPLWRSTAIGMMVNNVIPARAGEIARGYALSREQREVRFPAAIASLAIDRVMDGIMIIILLIVAMVDPAFPRDTVIAGQPVRTYAYIATAVAAAALVMLFLLAIFPQQVVSLFEKVVSKVAPHFVERVSGLLHSFADGLAVLRRPSLFVRVLFWTAVHWIVSGLSFWIGMKAVGIAAPFSAALFVQSLIAIGVAAPAAPGFFGVFEFFGTEGLAIYGVPRDLAVSWAIGFHLLSFIPITLLGAYYFARLGLSFRDVGRPAPQQT